jgi:hypothetical protein
MEWTRVKMVEPICVIIEETAKPSYAANLLRYFISYQQCPNKVDYVNEGNWKKDAKQILESLGYRLLSQFEQFYLSFYDKDSIVIDSAYVVPRVGLNEEYSIDQLNKMKTRMVQIRIPASLVENVKYD